MVPKKLGDWRPFGDCCALNRVMAPNQYPIPHIQDFTASLHGTMVFSKLDLVLAYHQILVEPANIPKTAIMTLFDFFEFIQMPFGLQNAAQSFKRFIDQVLQGLPQTYVTSVMSILLVPLRKSIWNLLLFPFYKYLGKEYKQTKEKPDAPLSLAIDASDVATGAALQQWVESSWQPLAFFSKKQPAERNYST
uniref:Uncharacterized protein n=1 Tax=Amphimedon queenslandica TaxID=400682 RepID=A0A1X7UDF3_AMPQE